MLCWLNHCKCMGLVLAFVSGVSVFGEFHKSSEAGIRSTVVRRSRSRDGKTRATGQQTGWNCGDLEWQRVLRCGHPAALYANPDINGTLGRSGELPANHK